MSKRVFVLGLGIALVALAFAAMELAIGPCPEVTEANVRRIRRGMTFSQVEAILGPPTPGSANNLVPGFAQILVWDGRDGDTLVSFGKDGGVTGKLFIPSPTRPARINFLDRLRSWLSQ